MVIWDLALRIRLTHVHLIHIQVVLDIVLVMVIVVGMVHAILFIPISHRGFRCVDVILTILAMAK